MNLCKRLDALVNSTSFNEEAFSELVDEILRAGTIGDDYTISPQLQSEYGDWMENHGYDFLRQKDASPQYTLKLQSILELTLELSGDHRVAEFLVRVLEDAKISDDAKTVAGQRLRLLNHDAFNDASLKSRGWNALRSWIEMCETKSYLENIAYAILSAATVGELSTVNWLIERVTNYPARLADRAGQAIQIIIWTFELNKETAQKIFDASVNRLKNVRFGNQLDIDLAKNRLINLVAATVKEEDLQIATDAIAQLFEDTHVLQRTASIDAGKVLHNRFGNNVLAKIPFKTPETFKRYLKAMNWKSKK
jgi:hypothetical protein